MTRRTLLSLPAAGLPRVAHAAPLDRRAIVSRHNPRFREIDARAPLSTGNGELAFTADFTGLQTFPELYEKTTPLCTQSQWGWTGEGVDRETMRRSTRCCGSGAGRTRGGGTSRWVAMTALHRLTEEHVAGERTQLAGALLAAAATMARANAFPGARWEERPV